ncbi:MAG: response regulator [Chloroflexales bacterium]|nr:response regulator [Chloroflexales bacterium]
MPDTQDDPPPAWYIDYGQSLRQQAEAIVARADGLEARSPEEVRRLVHELHVHQIELELQNDELRRTQDELAAARNRYFDLYDLAPVGYVTLSTQGLIQEANLTAATLLQVSRSNLLRQPFSRFIAPEDQDIYYQHHRGLVARGGPQQCELRMQRADRALLWVRLEASVAQDAVAAEVVYRTVIVDITARVQAEASLCELNATLDRRVSEQTLELHEREERMRFTNAELTRALRLKDEFLAMMSHELRTPLNIILGVTEALSEELYGPIVARQRQALGTLAQSGRHLLALLSDILDLARIAAGHETLELRPVDVNLLCNAALLFAMPSAHKKGVSLLHTVDHNIIGLKADERRLTQILVNLLDNAVKFTPNGGAVGLEVTSDAIQRRIQFSVRDNGVGIAEADHERLFEPFTQVDQSLSRRHEGVGLGLALVRRLVELHGGSIGLESAPGQGSRFTVSLPWSPIDNAISVAGDGLEEALAVWAQPPRVVIADDHEPSLQFYTELLIQQGCQVTCARSGDEALARVREAGPDVVVMDIQMPGMDGLEAIRHIRGDPGVGQVPIIALTALAMPGDRERCLAAGANVYLAKPVSLRTLVGMIATLLHPDVSD